MQELNNRFRWVTKEELIEKCLSEDVLYIINDMPSNDVALVKQLLFDNEGKYRYSISIDAPEADGKQVAVINYEIIDRQNR